VRYNPRTDTLLFYFYGAPEPAINVDVEDSPLYLMIDPETEELIGVHIQAFTTRFLQDHPHFRSIDVSHWSTADEDRDLEPDPDDAALQKSLAEMVIGSLVVEYGLRAA